MKDIYIEKTLRTPAVQFDFEKDYLEISGISLPENTGGFYDPLLEWIEKYMRSKNPSKTTVILKLFCYNTGSAVSIITMLRLLRKLNQELSPSADSRPLHIEWHYEHGDEDMEEEGKIMESTVKIPFIFRSCPQIDYRPASSEPTASRC